MSSVDAPKNRLVDLINQILDILLLGLGPEVAVAAAIAQVPWLGFPVFSWLMRKLISAVADSLDSNIQARIDNLVIRFQNDARKYEYDAKLDQLKQDLVNLEVSDEQKARAIAAAKTAIDDLVNRNR